MLLLGATRPDRIGLEKALRRWADESWFLDEAAIGDAETGPNGEKQLPKSWRLGSRPNLRQMHHDACTRVSPDLVEAKLIDEIQKLKSLTAGASAAGARVHNLPARPADNEDDGEFHYVVLGPRATSESGKPAPDAKRFIDEKTGPDNPRVFRNAIVLAVPSKDGLEVARDRIRGYVGWEEVRAELKDKEIDPIRSETLAVSLETSRKQIPAAIRQAYCIVVTVSDKNEVQAFKITVGDEPLFNLIKADSRARIQETEVSADALLPEGPYNLWRQGETARRVKDLVGAFAQFTHLPKMLHNKAILDTLIAGCQQGMFVLRLTRPDRSVKTFWRTRPDETAAKDPGLEVVLPQAAELTEIPPPLLAPKALPELWTAPEIAEKDVAGYFAGGHVVKIQKEGYEEPVTIPKAESQVVEDAIRTAVKDGRLWLTSGTASICREEIPAGILTGDAQLQAPPQPIPALDIVPDNLPEAWGGDTTTALGITVALSKKAGKPLPWPTVRDAVDGALRARLLELATDSAAWPCDYPGAQAIKLRLPGKTAPVPKPPEATKPGLRVAEAELRPNQIQDLAEVISDIVSVAAGHDLKFKLHVELGGEKSPPEEVLRKLNELLGQISEDMRLR